MPHFLHRLLQSRNLLALVLLLFRDFVDRSPQTLKLRVSLRPRPPIRLCELAELPILLRQLPLQVPYHRLEPDNLDVRVLPNEFPDLLSELDELELRAQRLEVNCVFHRGAVVAPSITTRNSWKCASETRERTSYGALRRFGFSTDSLHSEVVKKRIENVGIEE
jgi:hypothetical protein